jgi:endoglucanase
MATNGKQNLSHGLPWLGTMGSQIVRVEDRAAVLLRGVNRSGLEYAANSVGFLQAAGITETQIQEIVSGWGARILRLPFNQDWALHGRGVASAEAYLSALDQVIDWAAAAGAYTLLDLQWLDADHFHGHLPGGDPNFVAPLPNRASVDLWAMLARRYRDEPAVLFDLFNEPHGRLSDDEHALCLIDKNGGFVDSESSDVTSGEWLPWARKLVEVIRAEHSRSLIWVGGVDWAFDLRDIQMDAPNIVYSTHVYPNRLRLQWTSRFGHVVENRPLFIGEFGGSDEHFEWGARLLQYIEERACGWTAWSWSDYPRLVKDAQAGDHSPTQFGGLVRGALKLEGAPAGEGRAFLNRRGGIFGQFS